MADRKAQQKLQLVTSVPHIRLYPVRMAKKEAKAAGGLKYDSGKLPWDLLPWDAVAEVVKVLAFGAAKYAARNWERGLSHSRTFAASQRHAVAFFQFGERRDPETGLHPLAHSICEQLFALAFDLRGQREVDDTPGAAARRAQEWPTGADSRVGARK